MNDIQYIILEIYQEIKRICEKHGLVYYAIGGTCIGAVRHNGFIPWDDDLDIAIPIECWDVFWECMRKELPSYYSIYSSHDIKHYQYIFNKIHDTRTSFIEEANIEYPDSYKGIFVDVMPIGGIPKNSLMRQLFFKRIRIYSTLNYIRRYPLGKMNTLIMRILWIAIKIFSPFIPYHFFSDRWLNYLRKHTLVNSCYTGYTWSDRVSERLCFPTRYFKGTKRLKFENTDILCPVDYDSYLTMQFGDYMTLPPKEQRINHHQVVVDTMRSYSDYKGEI